MKDTTYEQFQELRKLKKATLYSNIGTIGYARHVLFTENNSGEKEQISNEVSAVGDEKQILENGLVWAKSLVGPNVEIQYSNNKNIILESENATAIPQTMNEAVQAFTDDLQHVRTLLS